MRRRFVCGLFFLSLLIVARPAVADDWKPAAGPLLTRFAKEVRPDKVWTEYPRPQMVRRQWHNLNGLWQFAVAGRDANPPIGKQLTQQILVPFPVESALSGVMKNAERVWYRRKFSVPQAWSGKHILLHFGAVDWDTTVWVNGKKIGSHRGGYDPFDFDITGALVDGGEQELIVGVYDPTDAGTQPRGKQVRKPHGIWYTPTTGIWQTVWLEPVPDEHVTSLRIVPDLKAGVVRVTVQGSAAAEDLPVRLTALSGEEPVATGTGKIGQTVELALPDPHPWSPADPFLYGLKVVIGDVERESDAVDSYFGMRDISIGKGPQGTMRLLLNGSALFQYGPLDQGFWPDGLYTAPSDAAQRFDLEVTKRLGFNMVRKHVKVEPERWYYWCDKMGLLVWQDMPSGDRSVASGKGELKRTADSAQQFESELTRMIETHINHPSIVMWVVFNEGWGQYDTARMTRFAEELDPSRLVCGASGWNDMQTGDVHDIHVYPGPGSPAPEDDRAAVLGEFGGLGLPLVGHTWQNEKNWGYRNLSSKEELNDGYLKLIDGLRPLIADPGLSAAVYTQTTDVEIEVNGLMTYDRDVIKVDEHAAAAAAARLYLPPPSVRLLVPTSKQTPQHWLYTLNTPSTKWALPEFDDKSWSDAPGGFGTSDTPGAVVGTVWNTSDIWLRRRFTLGDVDRENVFLRLHHDEDADIYLNGVLAAKVTGYSTDYELVSIAPKARAALRAGENILAIHCHQTGGGQYIDAGLVEVTEQLVAE
ncbi:MAG TPA: glycoside hydrolase family 2 TIM barrel-domain containing protein [Pirellulales bacterium]|nr:glycoside hydrolase family 2 TIM barrel-domain containing protein [Pirellulales bacterium]